MENYVVSARKYRPQTFETVVGQRSIVMTLKNAIRSNQLAQAFLFCGSRGVGKTSTARILAKTLNCTNRTPETEACNECASCNSFNEGSSLNVYELDAASNNSVDDIRGLIDQVRIAPQLGTHKVYIIDEVHMLSTVAFNAFLKTLEEPPKHAIFILATTEKHKIIPTILSRCQIFDFQRIKVKDIAKHLEYITQKENITAEADALHLIAQKADGALRDSLSIFDQIVSFTQGNVSYQAVLENLNVLDYDYFFKVVENAEKEDIPSNLLLFNEIMEKGFDGHNFLSGLSSHYRNILVAKDPATLALLEVGDTVAAKYGQQAAQIDSQRILRSIHIIQKAETEFKASKNQRLLVEWTLMQLCSLKQESEKKKWLTDKVDIIPFPNQKLREKVSPKIVENKPSVGASYSISTPSPPKIVNQPVGSLKTSNISIKEILNPPKSEQNQAGNDGVQIKETKPLELDNLLMYWKQYAHQLQQQDKNNLFSILIKRNPKIVNDNSISFEVDNDLVKDMLSTELQSLIPFLKQNLNNGILQVSLVIPNQENEVKNPYSPTEKFKVFAEKNPNIAMLQRMFNLDVDY